MDPPAGGGPGAGPRDPGLAGGTAGALLCGVGLDVGDLVNKQRNSTATTGLGSLCHHQVPMCCLQCSFFSFTSLYVPPFGFQGPRQASGCLQSYFRPHLTYRFRSLHILSKDVAALHSLQSLGASQHKYPELFIHREKKGRGGLPVSVGGPS